MNEHVWQNPACNTAVLHYACGLKEGPLVTAGWCLVPSDNIPMHWVCSTDKSPDEGCGGLIQTPPNNNEELFVWQHPTNPGWVIHWTCGTAAADTPVKYNLTSKASINPLFVCTALPGTHLCCGGLLTNPPLGTAKQPPLFVEDEEEPEEDYMADPDMDDNDSVDEEHDDDFYCSCGDGCVAGECESCENGGTSLPGDPVKWTADEIKKKARNDFGQHHCDVAESLGLDLGLNLPVMCADFYLLERIAADNTRLEWNIDGTRTRVLTAPPDTRRELWQMMAVKKYDERRTRIAEEFARYIGLACGGELRYAQRYIMNQKTCHLDEHEHQSKCFKAHSHSTTRCYTHQPKLCVAKNEKEYGILNEVWTCYCRKPGPKLTCDKVGGKSYLRCSNIEHEHVDACEHKDLKKVHPLLKSEFIEITSDFHRVGAWEQWAKFRERHGPTATRWMAEAFELSLWGKSGNKGIGGAKWGACARLVYDYEVGNIGAQTFIDRAWTMEHNGGNIFNKLYVTCGFYLIKVLEIQHREPYDMLAEHSTVKGLWRENVRHAAREVR